MMKLKNIAGGNMRIRKVSWIAFFHGMDSADNYKSSLCQIDPLLLKDTHYRNLFEIGTGSGGTDQNRRKLEEGKMFGTVYDGVKAFERPKYGCLNVGLTDDGDQHAKGYGDGYFLMNDTTVRWRTTMTIQDSFAVNGNCGTLKVFLFCVVLFCFNSI